MDVDLERTRRGVLAILLGGGIGGLSLSSASSFPERFAPLSGDAWKAADNQLPTDVDSPYGDATVRYDDEGVPHVTAGDERALYYAVGYLQAADRLFQMDVIRRQMRGRAAEAVGDRPGVVASDTFYRKLQFTRAAEATWEAVEGTATGDVTEAYAEGVDAYRTENDLPLEFRLLGYEPLEWTPVDTLLMQKRISWGLTGSFRTLRRAAVRDAFDEAAVEELYPRIMDHDSPILRAGGDARVGGAGSVASPGGSDVGADAPRPSVGGSDAGGGAPTDAGRETDAAVPDPALVGWLSRFEWPEGIGSNSWAVGGEYTDTGRPILANDPHLQLVAPPVWFEQRTVLEGEDGYDARGVTFPGVPFVIIGENTHGAWGYTNAGGDVVDFYTYDRGDGETYTYRGEQRTFETRTETVEVADGENVDVTVRTSVHGPVIGVGSGGDPLPSLEGSPPVGVAWTGFSATRTTEAVHRLLRSTDADEAREAIELFDEPTQCFLYVDDEEVLYWMTGAVPIRRTDGQQVRGTRVFDGSAGEGEWAGYEPFGESDWESEGFVPFEDKPHVRNPGYVATANQRIVDDPEYYLSEGYAPPFRGARIYERLDARAETDQPMDADFLTDVQQDVRTKRADLLVPILEDARDRLSGDAAEAADAVIEWNREMTPDSRGALVFHYWVEAVREATFDDDFEAAGIGDLARPNDWILGNLPPDSRWFAPPGETEGDRAAVAAEAMGTALERIDEAGHETYGDYNRTDVDHPFDQPFLNYPKLPADGGPVTVKNFRKQDQAGSSWRMVSQVGGESTSILPGGNSGDYFSEHYDDQLRRWVDGEYKPLTHADPEDPERVVRFRGESG